ncbi:ubiquitin thioesterase ZRANB1-like [Gigantopelta aegis]|uniref:ubiquitin thioesterase ZRANB1-like n=1 Tax=Gigantopelta aegis TaxID=1735272 RepID=UPI001B8883BB|nr:ubiquitin thioesterase ZRANB1-like [Gigantopelta aegis]
MSEARKWPCEYCTYENFPVAKRCTLCRAPRPLQLITNTADNEQDIYKMAPLVSPSNSPSCGTSKSSADSSKWACHLCTYLNWQRATKCSQCLTTRKKLSPGSSSGSSGGSGRSSISGRSSSSSSSTHQDGMSPLSVNVNIAETNPGRTTPKRNSPNSPEAAKAINNDINRTVAATSNRNTIKWVCYACTYENWPKTTRCVLCGIPRSDSNVAAGGNVSAVKEVDLRRRGRSSPTISHSLDSIESYQDGASATPTTSDDRNRTEERKLRMLRKKLRDKDWLWLNACIGVADGDSNAVQAFIAAGGDPARQLTQDEVILLNRPSAFQVGYTIVHLAIRFKREDMLAVLLTATDVAAKAVKRLPSHSSPDLAMDIRREILSSLRQRKGDFPCFFLADCVTFALPTDIEDLPRHVHGQLFDELLDREVQNELEVEENIVNWSLEICDRLGSRLYPLWNRTAGDCLLDSVLQATWGIFDIDNGLRRAMADSLSEGAMTFYPRWKEYESMQAKSLHFSLDESQWQRDWELLLSLASQPGASLEQTHIFALSHILRRPIIVYGVKYIKSFRGETIGFAKFEGVYLPLLWEQSFCWKTPIALGYTRGHFSALVPMETDTDDTIGAGADIDSNDDGQTAYLPLVDSEGKRLPVHFLTGSEVGREDSLLNEWLDCCVTKGGILVALQKLGKRPLLVKQMVDEWLDHYRQLSHVIPPPHQTSLSSQNFSSDGESDPE